MEEGQAVNNQGRGADDFVNRNGGDKYNEFKQQESNAMGV
jgi:hypothetical protein